MAELLSSKIVIVEEPPAIRSLPVVPTGIAGFEGIAKRGPILTPTLVTSFDEYVSIFGSYDANSDMTLAVEHFFRNGGTQAFITRICHFTLITDPTTYTAVKSTRSINDRGGAAAPAIHNSTDGPWHMSPGDHFDLDFDNAGTQVATIAATAASIQNGPAEPFNLVGLETLTVKVNNGYVQTVVFQAGDFAIGGAATAEEVAARINADLVDAHAIVTAAGTKVTIVSDRLGTGSKIEVTGGTANVVLIFAPGVVSGTGNVSDTLAVTPAEVAAMITILPPLAGGTAVVVGLKVKLQSLATGLLAEVEVVGTTVQRTPIFTIGVYNGSASGINPTLRVDGKYPGTYADSVSIEVKAPTSGNTDEFNLEVKESGVLKEVFPNLSMTDADTNYVEEIVNDPDTGSNLISCTDLDSPATPPADLPALGTYTLTGGNDGLAGLVDNDFIGSQAGGTGLYAFDGVQDIAIGPMCPGRCTNAVQNAQVDYAQARGTMFCILGPPAGLNKQQVVTYVSVTASLEGKSEYGAFYWPRVKVVNPDTTIYGNGSDITVDPCGMIAGVCARTDGAFPGGVYHAPAGIEYGYLTGCIGFETDDVLKEPTRDYVAPHRINPLTTFPGTVKFIDGHDSLKGNSNFPSVPERRGVIYIEQTIKRGLEVYRHGYNDALARQSVNQTVTAFLLTQMYVRAFRSRDPATAFYVDTSTQINPPSEEFAGRMNVKVGLATNKPNKWIVLTFSQDVRALQEEIANA
jgi:hypothetical protein